MIGVTDKKVLPDAVTYFDEPLTKEMSKSVLLGIHFHRIILDQAGEIANPISAQSISVCRIRSTNKWVIMPKDIREDKMYGFVRFLKISPLDSHSVSLIYGLSIECELEDNPVERLFSIVF